MKIKGSHQRRGIIVLIYAVFAQNTSSPSPASAASPALTVSP